MYWIDPDGQGVGEDPIVAFCNMTTGTKQKYSLLKISGSLFSTDFKVRLLFCTTANPGYPFRIAVIPDVIRD
jgi:hypothetical protein